MKFLFSRGIISRVVRKMNYYNDFFFNFYLKNIVHVYKLITVVFLIFELK